MSDNEKEYIKKQVIMLFITSSFLVLYAKIANIKLKSILHVTVIEMCLATRKYLQIIKAHIN